LRERGKDIVFSKAEDTCELVDFRFTGKLFAANIKTLMRSKASIKSHPIHPILVCFPLAFYIGTLLFDSLAVIKEEVAFGLTGQYLHSAGIIAAICAAIPGVIDYTYTVPPKSSAKKRAATHGILNTAALLIFGVALYCKHIEDLSPFVVIGLELTGVIVTAWAGWLGGTLVHRNQIGIDVRYAAAGKWNEKYVNESAGTIEACGADEIQVNQMKLIHIKDKRLVIGRTEKGFVAFEDRCPHKGGSLAGGAMICGTVQCPWHGSQFDVESGVVKAGPATENIGTYRVSESGGKVYVVM
jgi:nitrite reductase/ring-hydroxylating ferredoxin subunit/uncharacterized membrane protein